MNVDLELNRDAPAHPAVTARRILLHDYGTYPFTFELARFWAGRGHSVHLIHSSDVEQLRACDEALSCSPVRVTRIDASGGKYNFFSKPLADRHYGRRIADALYTDPYDLVISGNTPLNAQQYIAQAASRTGATFIYWMQDYISRGIEIALAKRTMRPLATAASTWYRGLEHRLLRSASAVVLASPQFRAIARQAGVADESCFVIENWCPLDDVTPLEQDNAWARAHGLAGERVLLYAGTLGLKHEPDCLLALAERLPHTKVVVVSQGPGVEWLRARGAASRIANLILLPLQPYRLLSQVLASATMAVAVSDEAAASFSCPSKILTYLVAGRPILGIMPRDCHAASLIISENAGVVVPPRDLGRGLEGVAELVHDRVQLTQMSRRARQAALTRCDINTIGSAFDQVLAFV